MATKKNTKGKKHRRYMKKAARRTIAALLMVTALIVAAIPATPGRAAQSGQSSGQITVSDNMNWHNYYFDYDSNLGGAVLVGYSDTSSVSSNTTINIPKRVSGNGIGPYDVVGVGSNAFYQANITQITLPETVVNIGQQAFYQCSSLGKVIGSTGLKIIGDDAFNGCSKLTEISTSGSLTSVGNAAFFHCGITGFPANNIASYGEHAFDGCMISGTVKIPGPENGTATIPEGAFANTGIQVVSFDETITGIGSNAFQNCPLNEINLPTQVSTISGNAFDGCSQINKAIDIPSTLVTLEKGTFASSSGIPYVTLHNGSSNSPKIIDGAFHDSVKQSTSSFYVQGRI